MEAEISFNRPEVAVAGRAMSEDRVRQPAYEALCVCPEHRCSGRALQIVVFVVGIGRCLLLRPNN